MMDELRSHPSDPLATLLINLWTRTGPIMLTSAGIGVIGTEIVRDVMVFTRGLAERLDRQREQRRAEGYAEATAKWEAWNKRREEAAAQGREFAEPPPSSHGWSA